MHVSTVEQLRRVGLAHFLGLAGRRSAPAAPRPAQRVHPSRRASSDPSAIPFAHLNGSRPAFALPHASRRPDHSAYDLETMQMAAAIEWQSGQATAEAFREGRRIGAAQASAAKVVEVAKRAREPNSYVPPLKVGSVAWQVIQAGRKRRGEVE